MRRPFRIAITTGDINGIGLEITAKALTKIRPQRGVQFYIWRSSKASKRDLKTLDRCFSRHICHDWTSAMQVPEHYKNLIDLETSIPPAKWVELMARSGLTHDIDALVTGPLSKTEIIRSGLKDQGHTGLLKRISGGGNLFMAFVGKNFNVVLLTGHVSIKKAYNQINEDLLKQCIEMTHQFKNHLGKTQKARPIGLVALNPHAGEKGVIDRKEENVFKPLLKKMKNKKISLSSILTPDVCFKKRFWKNYSCYIASYHDQGLIPFKMAHDQNPGVHISLGLPFLRTSVDHGTAKDIFGKNRADSRSMEQAIQVALKILKGKSILW